MRDATEKKTQLLLLGRKHIGFCLQTRKSVIKKSSTSISVAQIPHKRMSQDQKEVPALTPTEMKLQDLFGRLILSKSKQVILSLVHPYNQSQSMKCTLKL